MADGATSDNGRGTADVAALEQLESVRADLEQRERELHCMHERIDALERQVASGREQLRAMIDSAPNTAIFMVDPDRRIKVVNRVASEYFETSSDQIVGHDFDAFLLQHRERIADYEQLTRTIKQRLAEGDSIQELEVRLIRPKKTVHLFCCPVHDREECCLGWIWALSDITHLERAAGQLRTIVEASPVPLLIARVEDERILFANRALSQLLGVDCRELIGRKKPDIFGDAADRDAIAEGLHDHGRIDDYELRIRDAADRTLWTLLSAVKTELEGDVVLISALHDIDARKRAEDALKSALDELEQANRHIRDTQTQLLYAEKMAVLGALVAGIAHEIKTPIGAISSMQDTLLRAVDKLKRTLQQACPEVYQENRKLKSALSAIEDANQVIDSGSARVLDIVKRLRSFARVDSRELLETDIHAGIEDTLLLIHHETKSRIKIVKNFGRLPPVRCNPGQLNQVLLNLLVNAAQAIDGKGTITIATASLDGHIHIAITDDGAGIPKEIREKIFDPGFTTKCAGVGTGLGLSICCKIVREHRGSIEVQSELGKGTTVTVTLPIKLENLDEGFGDNKSCVCC